LFAAVFLFFCSWLAPGRAQAQAMNILIVLHYTADTTGMPDQHLQGALLRLCGR
jgi:hypothetical protein